MKLDPSKFLKLAAMGGVSLPFAQSVQAATLLQFGGTSNVGANDGVMEESYGDNVVASDTVTGVVATLGVQGIVGTPDITLEYNPNSGPGVFDSYGNWDGRTAVVQTQYDGGDLSLEFTPTISAGVLITSFDLDEYTGGGASVVEWSITNGATVIVSGVWNDFEVANGGRSTVLTGMTVAQAVANGGSTLALNLVLTGGAGSYQALDNLSFDQVAVPETSSSILSALGFGAFLMRRRRK